MEVRRVKLSEAGSAKEQKIVGHQKQLKEQLSRYIKLTSIQEEAKRNLELANALTSHGFCFGFVLTDAALESVGMLSWWQAALLAIAEWDGSKEALTVEIKLPNGEQVSTLDRLFFKILNFVVYHFASVNPSELFQITGFAQPELIKPGNRWFEVDYRTRHGVKTKRIFDKETATGDFTLEQWCALIKPEHLSDAICLIHSTKHVVRISYHKTTKKWMIYDPNYPIDNMHKIFESERAVYYELQSRLHTTTMAINLIALTPETVKECLQLEIQLHNFRACYTLMLQQNAIELMNVKDNYMILMMKYQPDDLSAFISRTHERKEDDREKIINLLCDSMKVLSKKKAATNLYSMLIYAPECFNALVKLAENEKNTQMKTHLISTMIECLTHVTRAGKTGIYRLQKSGSISSPLSEWIAEYNKSNSDKVIVYTAQVKDLFFKSPVKESSDGQGCHGKYSDSVMQKLIRER